MNHEIIASYVWTVNELIKSRENHQRDQCRPVFPGGIIFLSIMAILSGWAYYLGKGLSVFTFLFPLIGIYFLFLRKYDVRWTLRRHFKKRPDRDAHVIWTLNEDSFHIKTGESESKHNWSQITKIRKASDGFLLYLNEVMYCWLSAAAFRNEDDLARAEDLLRRKAKEFGEIR